MLATDIIGSNLNVWLRADTSTSVPEYRVVRRIAIYVDYSIGYIEMVIEIYCNCQYISATPPQSGHQEWCQTGTHNSDTDRWTIVLNRYQRDNLLWLLQGIMEGGHALQELNTGDWVGEIPPMLSRPDQKTYADGIGRLSAGDNPNMSIDALIAKMKWYNSKIIEEHIHSLTLDQLQEMVMAKIMEK